MLMASTDEPNFMNAQKWVPNRFNKNTKLVVNKEAFVPWSIGKFGGYGAFPIICSQMLFILSQNVANMIRENVLSQQEP